MGTDDEAGPVPSPSGRACQRRPFHGRPPLSASIRPPRSRLLLAFASLLCPLIVLGAVWLPELAHYHVPRVRLADEAVSDARRTPDDARLRESEFGQGAPEPRDRLLMAADKLLAGEVDIRGLPRMRVTLPFSAADLEQGPGSWQLWFAGLTLPRTLLRAFEVTRDDRYLSAARDMILGLARHERAAWLPTGLLWNDHAIAARISVLAMFWRAYRNHPTYDPAIAREMLEFAARSGYLLASPAHFTVATNHGVMQNVALLQLAIAFPTLPDARRYRETAVTRLGQQLAFYLDDEGVVLEHSPGYHRFGLVLLGKVLDYLDLLQVPAPAGWLDRYRLASRVLAQLELPDESLPVFGDTDPPAPRAERSPADGSRVPLGRAAPDPASLYPVAGYSVWWGGLGRWPRIDQLSQTVVAWSRFPGHAHKHADELSLWLWGAGTAWWSNSGYWPYHVPGRAEVESWDGSNAPHLVGESGATERTTELVASAWSEGVAGIHLRRRGPGSFQAERQVVHVAPNVWVVVDRVEGQPGAAARTVWTTSPGVELSPGRVPRAYALRSSASGTAMIASWATSPGVTLRRVQGSARPFAGWSIVEGELAPVPALIVEQPAAGSWVVAAWCLDVDWPGGRRCSVEPAEARVVAADDWSLRLPAPAGATTVARTGASIVVRGGPPERDPPAVDLRAPADGSARRAEIRRSYAAARDLYPRFRDLVHYRARASWGILALLGLQEALLVVVGRLATRWYRTLRAFSIAGWALVAIWLLGYYFR